jgi:Domain of unknown function (DUF4384)
MRIPLPLRKTFFGLMAPLSLCALATGQTAPPEDTKLTAREMFLAARDQAVARPKAKPATAATPARNGPSTTARAESPAPPQLPAPPSTRQSAPVKTSANPNGAEVMRASFVTEAPLGLRYTILKKTGGTTQEVPTSAEFQSGDRIQLEVEVSEPGYLYIVTQGSSGTWEVLFPAAEIDSGNNRVNESAKYIVPKGHVISFVGAPGTENLFLIFSRAAEPELDNLIYSLQDGKKTPVKDTQPERSPQRAPMMMASLEPINNSVVSHFRDVTSRDLVIEKVDDNGEAKAGQPQHQQDHSVYVVNPKGGENSRVVADILLLHK